MFNTCQNPFSSLSPALCHYNLLVFSLCGLNNKSTLKGKCINHPALFNRSYGSLCSFLKTMRFGDLGLNTFLLPWCWWTEHECESDGIILQIYFIFSANDQCSPPAPHRRCDFIFARPSSRYHRLSEAWSVSDSSAPGAAGRQALWLLQHAPY